MEFTHEQLEIILDGLCALTNHMEKVGLQKDSYPELEETLVIVHKKLATK